MKKFTLLASLVVLIAGCSSNDNAESPLVFKNNMDGIHAWNENHPGNIVKADNAHSGKYVCKISSENPYSSTFYVSLGDLSSKKLKKLKVRGWVLSTNKAAAPTLVVDIMDKNRQSIEYIAKDCRESIKSENSWFEVTNEINMEPAKRNNPENFIKVYFTSGASQPVLVDDMTVEFED